MLSINNVSKQFGGIKAVNNVSFDLKPKEITGLIGPNGAGKTSLFNLISGLDHPDNGSIHYDQHDITHEKPHAISRIGIGRAFQIVRPYLGLTAKENLLAGLCFSGGVTDIKQATDEADRILEFVELSDKTNTLAYDLTLSEKKSLEIAKALSTNPQLLLLDECFAGLNPSEMSKKMELVNRIQKESSITILMIEHVMKVIMELSQRIVAMAMGEIISDGTPQEVCNDENVIKVYIGEGV